MFSIIWPCPWSSIDTGDGPYPASLFGPDTPQHAGAQRGHSKESLYTAASFPRRLQPHAVLAVPSGLVLALWVSSPTPTPIYLAECCLPSSVTPECPPFVHTLRAPRPKWLKSSPRKWRPPSPKVPCGPKYARPGNSVCLQTEFSSPVLSPGLTVPLEFRHPFRRLCMSGSSWLVVGEQLRRQSNQDRPRGLATAARFGS